VEGFLDEVARRWDLPALHQRVLASQRRRRFVADALKRGRRTGWDHQPLVDAGQQYMRNQHGPRRPGASCTLSRCLSTRTGRRPRFASLAVVEAHAACRWPICQAGPTPDRVRETLFNWLGQDLSGWRCIDAFAVRAPWVWKPPRRGASEVQLVEQQPALVAQLLRVTARLHAAAVRVERGDGVKALQRLAPASMDLVLLRSAV